MDVRVAPPDAPCASVTFAPHAASSSSASAAAPTRRRFLRELCGGATLVGLAATGASGCAQRQTKVPVQLTWFSWGPQYPAQWTVGPGMNQRFGGGGGPGAGQPTPVPPEKILEQQISAFTADREDVTVKIVTERVDRYHEKLRAFAAAGQLPDVLAYDGAQAIPLVRGNVLYNLSRLQGSKIRQFLQNFPASYLEASSYRGKLFGVPYQSRQIVLYVNKTVFGGLSLPPQEWGNPNWTWTHFLEKASTLTQRSLGGAGRQFGTLFTGRPFWASLIQQNGGREFNREATRSFFDTPETIEAIQWAADLVARYRVAPSERENPRFANWLFDGGTVAMWPWYQHSIPLIGQRVANFEWDVYPLPMNRKAATYADWGYLSISQNTVDVDRAWELLSFLQSPEGDAAALREGVAGPIQRGTEPSYMIGSSAAKNKAAAIQAAHQPIAFRPQHEAWDQISSLMDFYLGPVFRGEQKAVYACRELRVVVDGVLAGLESSKGPAAGSGAEAPPAD
ncbi:MAG TPA: extracellular solute-binding protein [Chloroflexota bacterium]|nr:extracellular solute-binding protein [Chloroflexota bacterium]